MASATPMSGMSFQATGNFGINIQDAGSDYNSVAGNFIGTNAAGDNLITNGNQGIRLLNTQYTRIGTDSSNDNFNANERNLLSGNNDGVTLNAASYTTVAGNYFGTDATGTIALGNRASGVAIINASANNRIGTNADGTYDELEGNLIAASGSYGIFLRNAGSVFNTLLGNRIGTDVSGSQDFGTANNGIIVFGGATDNQIGGLGVAANIIVNSGNDGIEIRDAATQRNTIRGNSIYANHGLGIDLGNDGVTANDIGDSDSGPSSLLNFPVVTATLTASELLVSGFARPGSQIDFFIADPDPSGFGEGQTYLFSRTEGSAEDGASGVDSYTHPRYGADTTNQFSFTVALTDLPAAVAAGTPITATATLDADTSEFSYVVNAKQGGNQAPQDLTFSLAGTADEGDVVEIRGSYVDFDSADGHRVVINWGDGNTTTLEQQGPTVSTSDYVEYNGHRYVLITQNLSFFDAQAQAQRLGGHLATINNQAENDFLLQWLRGFYTGTAVTIGLNDSRLKAAWSGSPASRSPIPIGMTSEIRTTGRVASARTLPCSAWTTACGTIVGQMAITRW